MICSVRGSNTGPDGYEPSALTPELTEPLNPEYHPAKVSTRGVWSSHIPMHWESHIGLS